MTKVSKYLMSEDVEKRMYEVFWKTVADLKSPAFAEEFFNELLTPTEKIMLAKRLAISILLIKKYTYSEIVDIIKVSPVTIGSIARWLNTGGKAFRNVIAKILKQEKQDEFWDNLEQFLSELILPQKGTNWSRVRSEQWHRIREKRMRRTI